MVRDPKGRFQGYVLTGKDITEDKKTEEGLAQSEEVFRDFVENSGDMVQSLSLEGKFLYVNQVWKDTLGYCSEDLKALSIWDIIHPDQREPCMEHMQKLISGAETPCLFETVLVTKEGISIPMEVQCTVQMANGQPIRMRAILRDITARKKAESARLQRELEMQERLRLQSIETVSHGVAHTFNNALAIIMGQAELAQFQLTPESPCATPLQEILKISEQSASIVRKLLEHTGHVAEKIEPICLSSLVESIKPLLQAAVTSRCQIQLKLHRELPRIEADPARIRQAVISLVLNGFEALPDGRGEIIVSTGVENCDRSYLDQSRFSRQAESGEYVVLEVSDNGSGMSNEVQNQLFTPFFSTKFVGRGLGLSSLLGTVRSYGGFVNWASRVNEGTTFRVFIPAKKEAF